MEPEHHPFRKENDLNQTSVIMFQPLIFRGVRAQIWCGVTLANTWGRGQNCSCWTGSSLRTSRESLGSDWWQWWHWKQGELEKIAGFITL